MSPQIPQQCCGANDINHSANSNQTRRLIRSSLTSVRCSLMLRRIREAVQERKENLDARAPTR
jgi:hypothetical protein